MPNTNHEQRLTRLLNTGNAGLLRGGLKGLEKESLRVDLDGHLARTPHPAALGAALTHPHITTDYSEALLELVTPPLPETADVIRFLADIHSFVYQHLDNEMLWCTSMPCKLEDDLSIPIAEYGKSNVGMMKHVYRRGLGWRYGRSMQTISGVHFNYSFPETLWPALKELYGDRLDLRQFVDDRYFGMLRNFQRISWLLLLFFGASPAVCKSFFHGTEPGFMEFDPYTLYQPYATSLRMSDIGYKNKNQAQVGISYNSLDDYISTLSHATGTPVPEYQKIGVKVNGEYRQLNANILQIENEFYSFARPKQPVLPGERAILALKKRGVSYVEVRAVDVNAYDPAGADAPALRFIEALLACCLLSDSPPMSAAEQQAVSHNQSETARRGRDPGLKLLRDGRELPLREWAADILGQMDGVCEILDAGDANGAYRASLLARRQDLADTSRLPSACVLAEMRANGESFFRFARRLSLSQRAYFMQRRLPTATERQFEAQTLESILKQQQMEAAETLNFDAYLQNYFAQT
ncbi:MAG: glutamate--cysteine ligase [Gammaproteobacteria bacterium]|nr:glutamate--cysteine ligase [Gammaproteobacteria bacterium]MDE2345724.1 glutamate--cysteine ligase [Gammaproteobacteria bacterium]